MAKLFTQKEGDWKRFRELPDLIEVDFHYANSGARHGSYQEAMSKVYNRAFKAMQGAQQSGVKYILFRHGFSTSRPGATTARSVVRGLMRSKEATPLIVRRDCIQHTSVFVAAIRPVLGGAENS
jgi:hypothetical protein